MGLDVGTKYCDILVKPHLSDPAHILDSTIELWLVPLLGLQVDSLLITFRAESSSVAGGHVVPDRGRQYRFGTFVAHCCSGLPAGLTEPRWLFAFGVFATSSWPAAFRGLGWWRFCEFFGLFAQRRDLLVQLGCCSRAWPSHLRTS